MNDGRSGPSRSERHRGGAARDRPSPDARRHHAAAHPRGAPGRGHHDPWPARPAARRRRREFLAIPPLRLGRAVAERRLAALGARRSSLCPRAGMGGRAHGVAVAGPLAVHAVLVVSRARHQARPRPGGRFRARRGAGRGRRAHRHSRHHAADREPRRHRQDGAGDAARSRPNARACRRPSRAVAVGRGPALVGPVEPHRRYQRG